MKNSRTIGKWLRNHSKSPKLRSIEYNVTQYSELVLKQTIPKWKRHFSKKLNKAELELKDERVSMKIYTDLLTLWEKL